MKNIARQNEARNDIISSINLEFQKEKEQR